MITTNAANGSVECMALTSQNILVAEGKPMVEKKLTENRTLN